MATYEYFQPEYFKKFKCDGQACSAHCCKNWIIAVDKKTYKKYSHLKPKSAAKELLVNIKKNNLPIEGDYLIRLDKDNKCPFLTEDNLCGLQRKFGEDFLSETCRSYPRTTWYIIDKIYERSLVLTCPVAAKLILLETEPLKFEKIEIPAEIHNAEQTQILSKGLPPQILDYFVSVQETSIRILQERSLTIDRRLLMLGLYCDRLDELLETDFGYQIPTINLSYQSADFLQEQSAQLSAVLKFDARNYMKAMLGLLEKLYGKGNVQTPEDRKFIDAVINVLQIETDEKNQTSITETAENYLALSEKRQKFLAKFEIIFENYLVNEFFLNLYPLRSDAITVFNFGLFVTIYKMLELLAFAIATENENFTEQELIEIISWYVQNIDHNNEYFQKILNYLQSQKDIVDIMQSMLQL